MIYQRTIPPFHLLGWMSLVVLAGAPAFAQSDNAGGTETGEGKSPDEIVCAELTQMDTAIVPGTLYFLAGYNRGMSDSRELSGDAGMGDASGSTSGDTSGTASATTGTEGQKDTSGSTDTTASADTGTTGSGTDSATDTDTGNVQAGMPGARVSGFFEIPVESIITVCAEAPERQVSDVVEEQNSTSGQGSN